MLGSDLCDYSGAYIVVKGTVTVEGDNDGKTRNKKLIFKNKARFRSWISKINNTFIDNAEDLDIVMPMYNLLEYSGNYSMKLGSLWNYYGDEINDDKNIKMKIKTSNSFECKTKLNRENANNNNILDTRVVIPLKYLSNFCRSLDLPLINCELKLDLSWPKECIISEISITPAIASNPTVPAMAARQATGATFQINNAKLFVSVFTLSINNNIKFWENIKQGFKIAISW